MKLNRRFVIPTSSYIGIEMPSKEPIYGFKINDKGQKEFCVISEQDIAIDRNSYLECCDFKTLYNSICPPMSAFEEMADYMEQFQDLNLDDPIVFANYAEQLKDDFFALPEKIRSKYEHNIDKFAAAVYSGDFDTFIDSEFKKEEFEQQKLETSIEKNRPLDSDELIRIRTILNGNNPIGNDETGKSEGDKE